MTYDTIHITQSAEDIFVDYIREALNIVEGLEKKFAGDTPETEEIKTGFKKVEYLMQVALAKIDLETMRRSVHIPLWLGDNQDWKAVKQNLLDLFDAATGEGYLTLDEIKDRVPQYVIASNQLDHMVTFFVNMGARVFFKPPTEEELKEVRKSQKLDTHIHLSLWSSNLSIRDGHSDVYYKFRGNF